MKSGGLVIILIAVCAMSGSPLAAAERTSNASCSSYITNSETKNCKMTECRQSENASVSWDACNLVLNLDVDLKTRVQALVGRGRAYVFLRDKRSAIADLSTAIALNKDPQFIDPLLERGKVYEAQDKLDLALADYTKAISLSPNTNALLLRGLLYTKKRDFDSAKADLQESARLASQAHDIDTMSQTNAALSKLKDLQNSHTVDHPPTINELKTATGKSLNQNPSSMADMPELVEIDHLMPNGEHHFGHGFITHISGDDVYVITSGLNVASQAKLAITITNHGKFVAPAEFIASEGNKVFDLALLKFGGGKAARDLKSLLPIEISSDLVTPGEGLTLPQLTSEGTVAKQTAAFLGLTAGDGLSFRTQTIDQSSVGVPLLLGGRVLGMVFEPDEHQSSAVRSEAIRKFMLSNGLIWGIDGALVEIKKNSTEGGIGTVVQISPDRSVLHIATASGVVTDIHESVTLRCGRGPESQLQISKLSLNSTRSLAILEVVGSDQIPGTCYPIPLQEHAWLDKDEDVTIYTYSADNFSVVAAQSKITEVDGKSGKISLPVDEPRFLGAPLINQGKVVGIITSSVGTSVAAVSQKDVSRWTGVKAEAQEDTSLLEGLELEIRDELSKLNSHEDMSVTVELIDGRNAYSDGKSQIISIGRTLLREIKSRLSSAEAAQGARWILAHEFGHQIQAKMKVTSLSLQEKELQADLLAGLWMFRGFGDRIDASPSEGFGTSPSEAQVKDLNKRIRISRRAGESVIERVLKVPNVSWNDPHAHGTVEQRTVAFRNPEWQWVAVANELHQMELAIRRQANGQRTSGEQCSLKANWHLSDFIHWTGEQAKAIATYPKSAEHGFESPLNMLRTNIDPTVLDGRVKRDCAQAAVSNRTTKQERIVLARRDLDPDDVFLALRQRAAEAKGSFVEGDAAQEATRISAAAAILEHKWKMAPQSLTDDYLATIDDDVESITDAFRTDNQEARLKALGFARADLEIKAEYALSVAAVAETLGPSVKVHVVTQKGGQEIGGFLVRCNLKRHADQKDPMFVFNDPSPNAVRSLPPGDYVFWGEAGSLKSKSVPEAIGVQGESSQKIILPVD